MLKNIGIVGYGFVGKAIHVAFKHNTEAIIIDPKISDIALQKLVDEKTPITFVCVNAPTRDDGSVDATNIYTVFQQLADIKYEGVLVLKSTVPPSVVNDLYDKFAKDSTMSKDGFLRFVYSPEFLRESSWEDDAVEPQMIILGGNFFDCKEVQEIYERHSHVRSAVRFFVTTHGEAAMVKYTINTFLALKVAFFNQLYQMYSDYEGQPPHWETWNHFIKMVQADLRMGYSHMQVPGYDGQFGYGGSCFPKDVKAFIGEDKNGRMTILQEAELSNTKNRLQGSVDNSQND